MGTSGVSVVSHDIQHLHVTAVCVSSWVRKTLSWLPMFWSCSSSIIWMQYMWGYPWRWPRTCRWFRMPQRVYRWAWRDTIMWLLVYKGSIGVWWCSKFNSKCWLLPKAWAIVSKGPTFATSVRPAIKSYQRKTFILPCHWLDWWELVREFPHGGVPALKLPPRRYLPCKLFRGALNQNFIGNLFWCWYVQRHKSHQYNNNS